VDGRNKVTIKHILAEQGQETHHCYPWHYLVLLEQLGLCEALPDSTRTGVHAQDGELSFLTWCQVWVDVICAKMALKQGTF
jgi:hypothetical protein